MENRKDYLIAFDHEVDYFSYVSSDSFVKPNVSLCRDTENVFYHCKDEEDYMKKYFTIKNTGKDVLYIQTPSNISYMKSNETEWTDYDLVYIPDSSGSTSGNTSGSTSGSTSGVIVSDYVVMLHPNEEVKIKGNVTLYGLHNMSFEMTGNTTCDVEGNIMSLVYGDDFEGKTIISEKGFQRLFEYCTQLVNANNLVLPATTLARYCYTCMFARCTSLVNAPELPTTTLAVSCYSSMFEGCTSLVNAPELPATTLADNCYRSMFNGCTSLVTAPELPATTLAEYCYEGMFKGCTSLATAPELPATILAIYCYWYMFEGCTSLVTAPELPATTLANDCYRSMFYGCTSLVESPVLPATTLAIRCYESMFKDCSNLNKVTMLATDISAYDCLDYWLYGVASSGTLIKSFQLNSFFINIPVGWTVVDKEAENG